MVDYFLLENAIGSIQAGPDQQDRLDELTERLTSGEFYVPTDATIPAGCIDGRTGSPRVVPNAAGGSESLMVADDLTARRFADDDDTSTAGEYAALLKTLHAQDLPVGGHTDDHATGPNSGCGANDRLPEIYAFIAQNADLFRKVAADFGCTVSDADHAAIVTRAHARTTFSSGSELLAHLRDQDSDAAPALHGSHREVIAVFNTVPGTTLDRDALENVFGPDYEAFNIDIWSFAAAAEAITDGNDTAPIIAAMIYYNLGTAHVLCGPQMRVIVRK